MLDRRRAYPAGLRLSCARRRRTGGRRRDARGRALRIRKGPWLRVRGRTAARQRRKHDDRGLRGDRFHPRLAEPCQDRVEVGDLFTDSGEIQDVHPLRLRDERARDSVPSRHTGIRFRETPDAGCTHECVHRRRDTCASRARRLFHPLRHVRPQRTASLHQRA